VTPKSEVIGVARICPDGRPTGQNRGLTKGELIDVARKIASGVVHDLRADLKKALASDPEVLTAWEDITPLARNERICWIESAKKAETRSHRIEWGLFKP
jgi:hypothetical protein